MTTAAPKTQLTANKPLRVTFLLCTIISGLALTEQLSSNLLPLAISRFTEDAAIIGLILMLNPTFGFIAQPLIGILSDKIWTPIGRRAFFLVTCAPIVALCLIFIPEVAALWQLVVLVVLYQFFQDVPGGSNHPLLSTEHNKSHTGQIGIFGRSDTMGVRGQQCLLQQKRALWRRSHRQRSALGEQRIFRLLRYQMVRGKRLHMNFTGSGGGKDNDSLDTIQGRFLTGE